MKKRVVVLIILMVSFNLLANGEKIGKWNIHMGAGLSTFKMEDINDMADEEKDSGVSFTLGVRRWFTENIAFGGELDSMEIEYDNEDFEVKTTGYLLTVNYDVLPYVSLYSGAGMYYFELLTYGNLNEDSSFGFKTGIEANYPIAKKVRLKGKINYRNNKIKADNGTADFTGAEYGAEIEFIF
ncbi:MAG: outer membrane beta-barrel protein [Fusobacteriota bacterium]